MKLRTCCATVAMSLLVTDLQAGAWLKNILSDKKGTEQVFSGGNASSDGQSSGDQNGDGKDIKAGDANNTEQNETKSNNSQTDNNAKARDNSQNTAMSNESKTIANSVDATSSSSEPAKGKKEIVGDPIVLKIGNDVFRRSQVLAQLANLPPQLTQGINPEQLFFMLREQLVNTTLIKRHAKAAGIDRTAAFLKRVEQLKDELLMRECIVREIGNKPDDEASLKVAYTEYLRNFKKEKETQIFHIMVTKENDAKNILIALGKGEDFSKLAREKSEAPSKANGGDEGYIPIAILPPQLKDPLLKLKKKGDYTKEFVKVENTYHIFMIGDSRDSVPLKYDDAKPMLRQTLLHREMRKLVANLEKKTKVERFNEDGTLFVAPPTAPAVSEATAAQ